MFIVMKWYSRSKEDFREILILKYNQKTMKEFVLITTPDCVKCRFIKPSVEQWCKENDYTFKEMQYSEWMPEVTSVPCAMIGDNEILDYDSILQLITK
jgi:thiol-disulfide isomerase/thioredoxin